MYLTLIALALLTFLPQQQSPSKPVAVILERSVAQELQDTSDFFQQRDAVRDALKARRPLDEVEPWMAKHCRDFGDGPSFECRQKLAVLVLSEKVAVEWLGTIRSERHDLLSKEAKREIDFALCRALTPLKQKCFLG